MEFRRKLAPLGALLLIGAASANAQLAISPAAIDQPPTPRLSTIVVTATRSPEALDQIPADLSVVFGYELTLRDAHDMASMLALVPGVEAPAGGDAGPSSAVPSIWGLHEFDAFLLVVDGVPWGGAFNPMITTLDQNDVEQVEVLKGSASVMFGATSFVGVVQELHYPAGEAANEADLALGSYGSARGSASFVLPTIDDYKQSLAINGESRGFADKREAISDAKLFYRGALDVGAGKFTIDTDITVVRDVPPSPIIRDGAGLSTLTPINANFNPANARINQNEYHVALGYHRPTALGDWSTLASYARSDIRDVRAFLHPDLSGAADSQDQNRHIDDGYVDTHFMNRFFGGRVSLVLGSDLLYGRGRQITLNGNSGYTVPLDGSVLPPPTTQIPANEIGTIDDQRIFAGQYAQADWKPTAAIDVTGGVRLNETYEDKISSDLNIPPSVLIGETAKRTDVRLTKTIGVSYRAWLKGLDELIFYVDYRNAFKPSALDFGPDYTPDVLLPEIARSYECGLKGAVDGGQLSFQAELFQLDFHNLVVPTPSGALANAAGERLRGVKLESRWQLTRDLVVTANFSYHNAVFSQYLFVDLDTGVGVDVANNELPLSPAILAAGGILYTPTHGPNAALVVSYVGSRFLDEENMAPLGGFATIAARVGYGYNRYSIAIEGDNLTKARPPVTSSEFGSESFYLLNARTLWIRFRQKL